MSITKKQPKKSKSVRTEATNVRAEVMPSTLNDENRSVQVVFATATPVRRFDWNNWREFEEILSMDPKHIRMGRADNGLPVFDNHSHYSGQRGQIGIAEEISFDVKSEEGSSTIRFSKKDLAEDVYNDVKDGIARGISVGYRVHEYELMNPDREEDELPMYRAIDWEPMEISFAPIQADHNSNVKRSGSNEVPEFSYSIKVRNFTKTNNTDKSNLMERSEIIALLEGRGVKVPENTTDDQLRKLLADNLAPEASNSGGDNKPNSGRTEEEIITQERERVDQIKKIATRFKLEESIATKHIQDGTSAEAFRNIAMDEWIENDPGNGTRGQTITLGDDKSATLKREAKVVALLQRSHPNLVVPGDGKRKGFDSEIITEANANYRSFSLLEMCRAALEERGIRTAGLDKFEIAKRAISSNTTDFPVVLGGVINQVLLSAYENQADTWSRFCVTGSVSDFRDHYRLRMGSLSNLDVVNEDGEFKNKSIGDAEKESIRAVTKGNIINLSRQMIINDDLGAFTRLAVALGRAAKRSVEADVYELLTSNSGNGPTMGDGNPLFHASHNNIAGTAGAPTVAIVDSMRQEMANQKDTTGHEFIDVRPSVALSPLSLGSALRVLNTSQYDPDASNKLQKPNIINGMFQDVVDSPRLTGNPWYIFADPMEHPVLEVAFLDGMQEPYLESREGFSVDGLEWKVRYDYGVGAIDWRGVIKNAGS